ncbi:hypothetical protein HPB50_015847 [Hyalomma asiaticum]|uniref:Uncharacterized protein n=1 Tax=Hyalomma asiaticum TaxID=266040 RepID=A0ACB7SEX6_HYAAI|nr:hypothetical protein HPB50_015847 [Hyalomma asiaticum]
MRSHCVDRRRCRCEGGSVHDPRAGESARVRSRCRSALVRRAPGQPGQVSGTRRAIILDATDTTAVGTARDYCSTPRATTARFETLAPACAHVHLQKQTTLIGDRR